MKADDTFHRRIIVEAFEDEMIGDYCFDTLVIESRAGPWDTYIEAGWDVLRLCKAINYGPGPRYILDGLPFQRAS